MARAKLFDVDQALDRAMHVFWRQGYEATSMTDLVQEMGINRASLYATFGDKRSLFIAAIRRYLAKVNGVRLAHLTRGQTAMGGLVLFFDDIIQAGPDADRRLGCLVTNTAVEEAPRDEEIAALIDESLRRVEDALYDAVRSGQSDGSVAADVDPRAAARFLAAMINGLRVMARVGRDERTLRDIVVTALRGLTPSDFRSSVPDLGLDASRFKRNP